MILGGRQPARAVTDFERRGGASAGLRGLVVLDRDLPRDEPSVVEPFGTASTTGLDLFVWSQRHIESYLLVPGALARLLRLSPEDERIGRFLGDLEDEGDAVHAKSVLGERGALAGAFGRGLRAGEIARAMRREELHEDIHVLFSRISRHAGLGLPAPEVVVRPRTPHDR